MRFRIKETRHTRNISVDIDIKSSDEEFVGLLDTKQSPNQLKPIVEDAWKGLKNGNAPELCEEGVGGTYFIYNEAGSRIAVFKPQDEEPYNINNPKGYRPRSGSNAGFKEGILVGEASIRECAAYWLDHDHFAGVPATDLVLCQHPAFFNNLENKTGDTMEVVPEWSTVFKSDTPKVNKLKIGSFQEFINHDGDCEDLSRSILKKFPVDEVHKIAQLDIRIMNADRHGGNILYREEITDKGEETYELIPIDHGYAIPSTLDEAWFEWLYWPQMKEPMSERTLQYIEKLNVEDEIKMLQEKFGNTLRKEHYRVLRISTMLLKKGAAARLSLFDIASMICRPNLTAPSTLELLCAKATELTSNISKDDEVSFYKELSRLMDEEIKNNSLQSPSTHTHTEDMQFDLQM